MSFTSTKWMEDYVAKHGPLPVTSLQRFLHTMSVYEEADGDTMVIQATGNIYGEGVRTGVTWDDLRVIAGIIEKLDPDWRNADR